MAVNSTDLLFEQSERVRKDMPSWFAKFKVASNLFTKFEVEKVGERDYRIPFKTQSGGRPGTYNPNGGALGRGNRMKGGVMISTFFPFRMNFELTELDMDATANSEVAVKSAFKEAMKDALPEFNIFVDKAWHTDGTPVLATATAQTTTSGNTVYTCDTSFGVMRLRRGWHVAVYDTTQATYKGTFMINTLNIGARTVTLNGTVPSAAATDVLMFEGVTGSSPVGMKGLYYFNDYTTSGTTLSVNRATEPEIQSNGIDGSGGLNHLLGMQLKTIIQKRRGEQADAMVGLANPAQQAAVASLVMNVARYDIDKGNTIKDLLPEITNKFVFGGTSYMVDIHQNATRMDTIVPKNWGWAQLGAGVDFYKDANGQRFFTLYGGDGSPAAGTWFAMTCKRDSYCVDPGAEGVIYGLAIPTGF